MDEWSVLRVKLRTRGTAAASQHARRRHVPRRAAVIHDQVPPTPRSDLAQSSSAPAHHPTIVCVDVPSRLADYIDALCVRHGLLCDPALQQAAAARYARSGRALGAPEVGCASDALVATRERRNREVERARATHCTVCRAVRAWGLPPCGGCKWVPPPTPTCLPASRGLAVVLGWLVRSCGTARSGPTGRARLRLCAGLFYGPGVRDCARYHEVWR